MKLLNDDFLNLKNRTFNEVSNSIIHSKLFSYFLYYCISFVLLRVYSMFIGCIFWRLTGVICPGCGATRAIFSLLRLDFGAYVDYNVFALPILVCAIFCIHLNDLLPYISNRVLKFIYICIGILSVLIFVYWCCRLCGLIETRIYTPKSFSEIFLNLVEKYSFLKIF